MIKSFKDFDDVLKDQNIYEAFDNNPEKNEPIFSEKDIIIPEVISNNKYLLKISRIVLKKFKKSGIGNFGVYPVIVTIDGVPGVYFYNHNNPTTNIVICRNVNVKNVYLFKEFEIGRKNVADLILSTTKLGFSDIIDQLIDNLKPNAIKEGLIYEWVEGSFNYTENDIDKIEILDKEVRQMFINLLRDNSANSVAKSIFNNNTTEPFKTLYSVINDMYGKINQSNVKKVVDVFDRALNKKTDHIEVYNVLNDCELSSTAISSTSGVSLKVDSSLVEATKKLNEIKLEKDAEDYNNTMDDIYRLASAMCKYVKSNGDKKSTDLSGLSSRGMLITGIGGAGKSHSVRKALESYNMSINRDYHEMSSSSTAVKSLYKKFYDYNGKLLIFDDTGDLFDTGYKISFWKQAMQTKQAEANVALTQSTGTSGKVVTNNTYATDKVKNRQQRYFLEIGQSTHEEKEKFYKIEKEKRKKKFLEETGGGIMSITKKIEKEWEEEIDDIWNRMEEEKEPLMPDVFNFKGVVIIISNETIEGFQKSIGFDNWTAIDRRFACFDLHPLPETLWGKIKEILLEQRDTPESELPDEMCMIPRLYVDELIEEVETNLENPETRNINFSIIADTMNTAFSGEEGISIWKRTLKRFMKTLPISDKKK